MPSHNQENAEICWNWRMILLLFFICGKERRRTVHPASSATRPSSASPGSSCRPRQRGCCWYNWPLPGRSARFTSPHARFLANFCQKASPKIDGCISRPRFDQKWSKRRNLFQICLLVICNTFVFCQNRETTESTQVTSLVRLQWCNLHAFSKNAFFENAFLENAFSKIL